MQASNYKQILVFYQCTKSSNKTFDKVMKGAILSFGIILKVIPRAIYISIFFQKKLAFLENGEKIFFW